MLEAEFKAWMQAEGYSDNTVNTQMTDVRRIEDAYGNLDQLPAGESIEGIREALRYSKADERAGRPNPSKFQVNGNLCDSLAHFRATLNFYQRFIESRSARNTTKTLGLTAQDIIAAISRCDEAGSVEDFLSKHEGLGPPKKYWVLYRGKRYPSKAIVRDALLQVGSDALPGGGDCKLALDALGFVVIDWSGFSGFRDRFLSRMEGFTKFSVQDGPYWEIERSYKDQLVRQARQVASSGLTNQEAGERIYRSLCGGQGAPLGWRTLAAVEKVDAVLRDRFFDVIGCLARSEDDPFSTICDGAGRLERLRAEGIAALTRGEVLSISITVVATLHPESAPWFKIRSVQAIGKELFARKLFPNPEFTRSDLDEFLQLMRALFDLLAGELEWAPADLFDVQGFLWVALPEESQAGEDQASALANEVDEVEVGDGPFWFVGAAFGRTNDQFDRFITDGTWEIDTPSERHRKQVLRMKPGQRIAIKSTYTRKKDLPFDNQGRLVSVMAVKAVGTITGNDQSGKKVSVAWDPVKAPREWYHYVYQPTIWEVYPVKEMAKRLIRFAFADEQQDYSWFLQHMSNWGGADTEELPSVDPVKRNPTNLILYGPPGTGKTYRTMAEAVRLCLGLSEDDPLLTDPAMRRELRDSYEELKNLKRIGFVTFHQNYAYEDFVEGLRPKPLPNGVGFVLKAENGILREMANAAEDSADEHVLIIDEINRANVSKVFGELITLIEPDKRVGMDEGLKLTLPYSGARFGVPANLHIIGTMNTADRSIALLDTALRRRFEFRELMPEPSLLRTVDGINLSKLLTTINERVEYLFDREHQLGHAYFIRCEGRDDVDEVMRHKVLPLLSEYFYDDLSKVAAVLGDTDDGENDREGRFIDRRRLKAPGGWGSDDEGSRRYRWTIRSEFSYDGFLSE